MNILNILKPEQACAVFPSNVGEQALCGLTIGNVSRKSAGPEDVRMATGDSKQLLKHQLRGDEDLHTHRLTCTPANESTEGPSDPVSGPWVGAIPEGWRLVVQETIFLRQTTRNI